VFKKSNSHTGELDSLVAICDTRKEAQEECKRMIEAVGNQSQANIDAKTPFSQKYPHPTIL
jgi:hypothetical protein